MIYIPSGWFSATELGDVEVIFHKGYFHIFHLNLPSHDVVSHIVSKDGFEWQPLPNAIHVGNPGEFDDDQIWTMGVFRYKKKFFMLYTGLSKLEEGLFQRVGLAISDDLVNWEKWSKNPVSIADKRWYESKIGPTGVDWRDPFVFEENGVLHALVSARENKGPLSRRGCVAHLISQDGYNWKVCSPLHTPRISFDFEVPSLIKIGKKYYLTGHLPECGYSVYYIADKLEGPYRRPENNIILPPPNSAFRPCYWKGKILMFHWNRTIADWIPNNPYIFALVPPKEVKIKEDGSLILSSFSGWKSRIEKTSFINFSSIINKVNINYGIWRTKNYRLEGICEPGMGTFLLPKSLANFIIEGEIEYKSAHNFGILFRSDKDSDEATFIFCKPDLNIVELVRIFHNPVYMPKKNIKLLTRGRNLVQSNYFSFQREKRYHLHLIVSGPYVEFSLDDKILLCALTMNKNSGQIGFFVEDGIAVFSNFKIHQLKKFFGLKNNKLKHNSPI